MADKNVGMSDSIVAANRYILPLDGSSGGSLTVHFASNAWVGSGVVIRGRVGAQPWLPIPYVRLNVASSASDGTVSSSAVADSGVIQIPLVDGLQIALDATGGFTSGSLDFTAKLCPVRS